MSNFKDTVYSILNEDAGDTDQEIRRKANTAALMNKGLKGQELVAAIMKYDASKKRSAAEVSAAADNRGREEAVGMVASGEATSMGDARNRMGVRDQVAAERARMAKNPVREVGIASPSSQIGGAGTQYGNSPNRAPETEAEIKYRTGTSAPMADNDPITGKPILFSGRNKRNQSAEYKQVEVPQSELVRKLGDLAGIPRPMQNDTTPGSEPGGWKGEDQGMADLHNTPAWQKMWAAGQNKDTQTNMQASAARLEAGREKAFKLRQDLRQAQIDNPIDTGVTFTRGSNGKGRQKSVPTSSYDQRRQQVLQRRQAEDSARTGYYPNVKPNSSANIGQGSKGTNNYGSAGSQTSPEPDGPGAGGAIDFNTGTTEVNLDPVNDITLDTLNKKDSNISLNLAPSAAAGTITTSAMNGTRVTTETNGVPDIDKKVTPANLLGQDTGNIAMPIAPIGKVSRPRKPGQIRLPGDIPFDDELQDGYVMKINKALTFFAEQLKRKYIEEEVVNPENQPMTKSEISHRNKIRGKSPAKDARAIKGSDTKENAEYRLATYITMRGRKGKKKENK